jgi:hypothetical protein
MNRQSILLKKACMVTHKKDVTSGDVTSGNDKLIHVPVPSFAKLATFIYGFFYSQIHQ